MSSISFENYRRLADDAGASDTVVAGRYAFQAEAERGIVADVAAKLALTTDDSLLEIGCGPGNLLLPLRTRVRSAMGIDNAAAIARLIQRGGAGVETLVGNFHDMALPAQRHSKVLIYSVIQYVDGAESAYRFLDRALSLVEPGGRLLLGDLPNRDRKARFAASPRGIASAEVWAARVAQAGIHPMSEMPDDPKLLRVDDALILALLQRGRVAGFESFLLPQPADLPFGNSREDLLFVAHA
jgi:cyclopropane fatty-acyl-phospholipid synthase-like methyltransferase